MAPDAQTITLEVALRAILAYDVDRQALAVFQHGLGGTVAEIRDQVVFIGDNYGGVAGFRAALVVAPKIAEAIYRRREDFVGAATGACPLREGVPSRGVIETLYAPFVQPCYNKQNWQVWGAKFWHFLNHDAFPLEDSRVDRFFKLDSWSNSADKYLELLRRFRSFILEHDAWLPQMRAADGGLACCENKLWDKMCYGVYELQPAATS